MKIRICTVLAIVILFTNSSCSPIQRHAETIHYLRDTFEQELKVKLPFLMMPIWSCFMDMEKSIGTGLKILQFFMYVWINQLSHLTTRIFMTHGKTHY